ncbi:MAG: type II toxin-antitoxin system HigB family toxin [Colwellia sp.]
MHVISRKPFNDATRKYPNDASAIEDMFKLLKNGIYHTPEELKKVFGTLDNFKYKDKWWVIDIGGNNLRLIAFIEFQDNRMYVKHICSHADYDKICKSIRRGLNYECSYVKRASKNIVFKCKLHYKNL